MQALGLARVCVCGVRGEYGVTCPDTCSLCDCQTVAFLGNVDFAPGKWVGVVLDRPTGLIDGCVVNRKTNVRREYFACKPNYVR